jgi:hypothetical protein
MHQKKVISKTNLTNMSKSGKSVYFRHVFVNNFLTMCDRGGALYSVRSPV